jgi:hypothetical protein
MSVTGPNMIGQGENEKVARAAGRGWEAVRLAAGNGLQFSLPQYDPCIQRRSGN